MIFTNFQHKIIFFKMQHLIFYSKIEGIRRSVWAIKFFPVNLIFTHVIEKVTSTEGTGGVATERRVCLREKQKSIAICSYHDGVSIH